jgi:RNA recognition motif-containing protein
MLYIGNLPIGATEDVLAGKFGRFGVVLSVRINRDPTTGRSERSGFIEMQSGADAQTAVNGLNQAEYDGRLLLVRKAVVSAPAPAPAVS